MHQRRGRNGSWTNEECLYAKALASPRSVHVCLKEGIDPETLKFKEESTFKTPGIPDDLVKMSFDHHESIRQDRLKTLIGQRDKVQVGGRRRPRSFISSHRGIYMPPHSLDTPLPSLLSPPMSDRPCSVIHVFYTPLVTKISSFLGGASWNSVDP